MPLEEKYSPQLQADIKRTLQSIPGALRCSRLDTVDTVREIEIAIGAVVRKKKYRDIGVVIEDETALHLWHPDYTDPEGRSSNWPRITIQPTSVGLFNRGVLKIPQTFTPDLDIKYQVLRSNDENWRITFENIFRQAVEDLGLVEQKPLTLGHPFTRINLVEVTGEEAIYFGQIPEARVLLAQALKTREGQIARLQKQLDKLI